MIGLTVLNGWGLTETSPVLACRRNLPLQVRCMLRSMRRHQGPYVPVQCGMCIVSVTDCSQRINDYL